MVRDNEIKKGGNVMAVTKVTANTSQDSAELKNTSLNYWSGNLTSPIQSGNYGLSIKAYDDAGNVATASRNVEIVKWKTPKVDWKPTDKFNFVDYNRIKNNLEYLHEKAIQLYKAFSIIDMGEDILVYTANWDSDKFNLFEKNLETINKNVYTQNIGASQTFYPNGIFIKYDELNRIENASLLIKTLLDNQTLALRRFPFRLGAFKGVRI